MCIIKHTYAIHTQHTRTILYVSHGLSLSIHDWMLLLGPQGICLRNSIVAWEKSTPGIKFHAAPSVHPLLFCLPHSPPGYREEPYLTEAGRDAFDRFCRLCHGELQALSGGLLQAPKPVLVEESELVKDSLNVLLGVVSATFSLCQVRRAHGYQGQPCIK